MLPRVLRRAPLVPVVAALLLTLLPLASTVGPATRGADPGPALADQHRAAVRRRARRRQGRGAAGAPGHAGRRGVPRRRYRWLRDGEPVPAPATAPLPPRRRSTSARIAVEVRVRADGHAWTTAVSEPTRRVAYAARCAAASPTSVPTRGGDHHQRRRLPPPGAGDVRRRAGLAERAASRSGGCPGAATSPWCWPPRRDAPVASPPTCSTTGPAGSAASWSSTRSGGSSPHRRGTRRGPGAARLPAHGGQPRDRPLARPRTPWLPGAGSAGAGDDAAVQGALDGCRFNPWPLER